MRLCNIRRLMLAAVPFVVAAALLGPMAGAASAQVSLADCDGMISEVYEDWAYGDFNTQYAQDALAQGDYIGWGYYNSLAAQYNTAGDELYNHAIAIGCA
jgi:hypothetical protein